VFSSPAAASSFPSLMLCMTACLPPRPTLFPYTTLFRSRQCDEQRMLAFSRIGPSRGALLPRGAPRSAANSASTSRRDSAREFTICVIEDANSAHESRNRIDFRAIVHLDVILSIVRQQLHGVPAL